MDDSTVLSNQSGPEPHSTAEAMLPLPAYLALALASGAACYGISHYVTLTNFSIVLYSAWLLALLISLASWCGPAGLRRVAVAARWLLIAGLAPLVTLVSPDLFLPQEARGEGQQIVVIGCGWLLIVFTLFAGARYGRRLLPLAAPLLPGLAVFGLLNEASVDNVITLAFLVYIAAALYLVVYEWMLLRHAREAAVHRLLQAQGTVAGTPRALRFGQAPMARPDVTGTALLYLLACSAWFACFITSGILIYYPAKAVLPGVFKPRFGGGHGGMPQTMDWRRPMPQLQLHGGLYTLSDQEVLRVVVRMGRSDGLWRGRVYQIYHGSTWISSDPEVGATMFEVQPGRYTSLGRHWPGLDPLLGQREPLVAEVTPLVSMSRAVLSSGDLVAVDGPWPHLLAGPSGTVFGREYDLDFQPYRIKALTVQLNQSALAVVPGLTPGQLDQWRQDPEAGSTLEVPDDQPGTRSRLLAVARQIRAAARASGNPMQTPYQKVRAINDYLYRNCVYSLMVPSVPVSEDAVVFFLTESHQGACDLFASAMALLLRAMDVPARVATGYLETSEQSHNDNGTPYTFRERDAHAWTEYYLPAAGWLDFDPTAGTRTTQTSLAARLEEFLHFRQLSAHWQALLLPAVGLLLLLIGGIWTLVDLRHDGMVPLDAGAGQRSRIAREYMQAVQLLDQQVAHASHDTPQEYEAAVHRSTLEPAAKQEFAALTYLFTRAYYAAPLPEVDEAAMQQCVQRLRQALGRRQ